MNPVSPIRRPRAFTLIELLTVIAIIGILAAIIIPVVGRVRESAKRVQCLSNVRQIGIAMKMYADEHKQVLPPMYTSTTNTWAQILVDEKFIPKSEILRCPSDANNNGTKRSDPAQAIRSYCYNGYVTGSNSGGINGVISKIKKEPSQLILVGDGGYNSAIVNHSDSTEFYSFANAQHNHRPGNFAGPVDHNAGANFAFLDLHVAWLPWATYNTDPVLLTRHWDPSK